MPHRLPSKCYDIPERTKPGPRTVTFHIPKTGEKVALHLDNEKQGALFYRDESGQLKAQKLDPAD